MSTKSGAILVAAVLAIRWVASLARAWLREDTR